MSSLSGRRRDLLFLAMVSLCLALLLWGAGLPGPSGSGGPGEGLSRSLDAEELRRQIRDGRLSGHEADHYRPLSASPSP